jgi:peptide/nickel transport system substrate-binding protein
MMFHKKTIWLAISIFVLLSMMASACVAQPAPETIVETVVVEKEVEKIVEKEVEKVVEKEVEKVVEKEVLVEVAGAIPYPESVPMLGSAEARKFNLDEMITYKALPEYSQAPWLDDFVADGTLPPVEERLPEEPQVFLASGMSDGLGEYGGVWRDFSACPTEGWNLGAQQTQGWFGINIIYQEALLKSGPIFMRADAVEPFPNLAKSWEWSDDGTELTMELIEGAKWSDGEPFTSEDVMFTWEDVILDDNVNSYTSRTTWQIDGEDITLEALDDYTLKWTFPVPFPVQKLFSMDEYDFYVVPAHVWQQYHPKYNADADYESFQTAWPPDKLPPVTMGPFVAVEYKTDEIMVLRRNPYYWKVDEAGKQLPYIDEVLFEKGTSGVGRTLGTLAGSIDHTNLENPGTFIETLKRQAEPDAHFYVEWGPETLGYYLQLNQSETLGVKNERDQAVRGLFRDARFRRAVSQAVDRDGIAQSVVRGPFLRPWPGGLFPGSPYFDRACAVFYPYSPDTSQKLLAELGFEDTDGNGIVNWTSGPLEGEDLVLALAANEDQQASVEVAEALVPLLGEVGIQVNLRPTTSPAFRELTVNGEWEMHVFRGNQEWAVPFTYADRLAPVRDEYPEWHRADAGVRELQPFEQELIDIANEFALEPDNARRLELMCEYNKIFTENVYDVGVVIGRYGLALAKRFENVPVGTPTFLYQWTWANAQPDAVWIAPEAQLEEIRPGEIPVYE